LQSPSWYSFGVQWRGPPGTFEDEVRSRLLAPPAELILDALPPLQPQTRFLEVQAGGGVMARAVAERIAGLGRLVSIDDDDALASVLPNAPRRAARAHASVMALPFVDASFDVAIANLVVGADAALDTTRLLELRRVLRAGGWLLVSVVLHESFGRLLDVIGDVADDKGLVAIAEAIAAARQRLPDPGVMQERLLQAGLVVAQVGLEERLLGLYRGAMLFEDPLIKDVILGGLCRLTIPDSLIPAIVQATDGWYPAGLPVTVHTMVLTARPERR
jgi:SAM-dependent methyltransferase